VLRTSLESLDLLDLCVADFESSSSSNGGLSSVQSEGGTFIGRSGVCSATFGDAFGESGGRISPPEVGIFSFSWSKINDFRELLLLK